MELPEQCTGLSRREVLIGMGASVLTLRLGAQVKSPIISATKTIEVVLDTSFRQGLYVLNIEPGKGIVGTLCPAGESCKPIWSAAQWYSHYNLGEAKEEQLPSGSTRFFDGAKAVTFGRSGSPEADLILALNGRKEFNDVAPTQVGAWPNFLLEQRLLDNPALPKYHSVPLRISYRLLHADAHRGAGWNEKRHSAQFGICLTIQNFNSSSAGHGDYLWFRVPMFDARYALPHQFFAVDKGNAHKRGTGKFIFNPGGAPFSKSPAIDGNWITIDHDLLPLIRESLDRAWSAGFLSDSHKADDYHLGGMNIGWEVTGPWDVAMQIRNLSLLPVVYTK